MKGFDLLSTASNLILRLKKRHARRLAQALRKLGYEVAVTPIASATAPNGVPVWERIFDGTQSRSAQIHANLVANFSCAYETKIAFLALLSPLFYAWWKIE